MGETTGLGCRMGYPQEGSLHTLSNHPLLLALLGLPRLPLSSLLSSPQGTALVAGGKDVCSLWDC